MKQIIFENHSPDVEFPCCSDDYSCLIYYMVFRLKSADGLKDDHSAGLQD